MSLRAPLARVLNHGSAHEGVHHWVAQRVSSLALAPLSIWLVWQILSLPDSSYHTISGWIADSWNPVLLALFIVLSCWHAWLGLSIVIEDYVHTYLSKTLLLLLSAFLNGLMAASGVYAVLRVAIRSMR
jgi:succinate dehydrogenase / fumarate reductase, membrane anchor subunit